MTGILKAVLKSLCYLYIYYSYTLDCCVSAGMWFSPEVVGVRPPPCAAFSFTPVDGCRVALFGGRQLAERTNQLHILDMAIWVRD